MGVLRFIGNVIWFIPVGLSLMVIHVLAAAACFLSIVGIPFGWRISNSHPPRSSARAEDRLERCRGAGPAAVRRHHACRLAEGLTPAVIDRDEPAFA